VRVGFDVLVTAIRCDKLNHCTNVIRAGFKNQAIQDVWPSAEDQCSNQFIHKGLSSLYAREIKNNLISLGKRNLHLLSESSSRGTGANETASCEISKEKFGAHNYGLHTFSKLEV